MNEKFNITADAGVSELTIRQGTALPLHEPEALEIKGTIDAPLRFLQNRAKIAAFVALACHIVVNKDAGFICLHTDERNFFGDEITGTITINDNIAKFGINNGKYSTPEDMSNFLRERKHLFESQAQYSEIFSALRNFRAKVNQQIAAIKDDAGNYEMKRDQVVEHNIPKTFKLNLPIFKGMPKVSFEVEFLVNKSLDVTLYSTELIQITDELRDKYISDVVAEIEKVAPDIVIMYQ